MRFEDVTELSSDAVAFYDKADKLVMCNDGYAKMVGLTSPDQLKGLFFADIVRRAVESDQFVIDADIDFVAQRTAMRRVPTAAYTLQTKSGTSYLVRDRATRDGGRAVVFTDVTDNRRTEAALDEQIQALKRTQHALASLRAESVRQASYLEDVTRQLGAVKAEAGTAKTALRRTMSHGKIERHRDLCIAGRYDDGLSLRVKRRLVESVAHGPRKQLFGRSGVLSRNDAAQAGG